MRGIKLKPVSTVRHGSFICDQSFALDGVFRQFKDPVSSRCVFNITYDTSQVIASLVRI